MLDRPARMVLALPASHGSLGETLPWRGRRFTSTCRSRRSGPAARRTSPTCTIPQAGAVARPPVDVDAREDPRPRLHDHPRARPRRRGGRSVGRHARPTTSCCEGLRHMMTLRAFDARMQMAQRQGKTSFYMQHLGEEAIELRLPQGARARRHVLPDLPPAGPADRRRLSDGRDDEPDLFQRARPAEGPAAAGDVLVARSTASSRSPATSRTQFIQAVGWAMASAIKGDTRIAAGWIGDGSTAEARLPRRAGLRLDLPGAGDPQHRQQPVGDLDLPGHRPRRLGHLRRARPRLRHPVAARRRQRLSSPCYARRAWAAERARRNLGPTLIEYVTYRVGAHSTSRRSVRLPARRRVGRLAARRSGRAAEAAPDRARRLVARSATSRPKPRSLDEVIAAQKEAETLRHAARRRASRRRATCSRTSSRRCRRTCARQRAAGGSLSRCRA